MRAVVQRVLRSAVVADGRVVSATGKGLLVLVGVGVGDGPDDARYLAQKVAHLRIFEDERGKMNLSVLDVGGEVMVVSQFTLYGDCRHGRRPSFERAAGPKEAQPLYGLFMDYLREQGARVAAGIFGAHMQVELVNDGPVTVLLDSRKEF